jgi:hypothetical protein
MDRRGRGPPDSMVTPGHASTPAFNDPAYPVEGRFPAVG